MSPSGGRSGPPLLLSCVLVLTKLSKQFFFSKGLLPDGITPSSEPFITVSHTASNFKKPSQVFFFAIDLPRILSVK